MFFGSISTYLKLLLWGFQQNNSAIKKNESDGGVGNEKPAYVCLYPKSRLIEQELTDKKLPL